MYDTCRNEGKDTALRQGVCHWRRPYRIASCQAFRTFRSYQGFRGGTSGKEPKDR